MRPIRSISKLHASTCVSTWPVEHGLHLPEDVRRRHRHADLLPHPEGGDGAELAAQGAEEGVEGAGGVDVAKIAQSEESKDFLSALSLLHY